MLPFQLIGQPDYDAALQKLGPARDLDLLVLYHGELSRRSFLGRILGAAGYRDPGTELHLLEWSAAEDLDLRGLIRQLGVSKVILFGYPVDRLGLHFSVANYFPVTVGEITYLLADSLEFIEQQKTAGDNRPAAALWNAIKDSFLQPSQS